MDTPKINFLNGLILGASVFHISTYLREKCFDMVWGHPPWGTPKNQFLIASSYDTTFF